MTERTRVSSGAGGPGRLLADGAGGDRAIVTGTTAMDDDGEVVAPGDPYRRTVRAVENVAAALRAADASLAWSGRS